MKKILELAKSETIQYLFFGGLATLVYIIVKFITWQAFQSAWGSEVIAQSCSIIFAFFTNKIFVFKHKSDNLLKDFLSFVTGRVALLLFAIFINYWFVDEHPEILMNAFGIDKNVLVTWINLALQVFIIVVNYVYSKFIVFKKEKAPADVE